MTVGSALGGLRVVDFSNTLSGTQISQLLADFGADVVHVEPPGGSVLRTQPAWPFWGRGKRSIVLDLKDDADASLATSPLGRFASPENELSSALHCIHCIADDVENNLTKLSLVAVQGRGVATAELCGDL